MLTPERLDATCQTQAEILLTCSAHVAQGGVLAYVTCSMLREENQNQVARFLETAPDWACGLERQFLPKDGGDGFFLALFQKT